MEVILPYTIELEYIEDQIIAYKESHIQRLPSSVKHIVYGAVPAIPSLGEVHISVFAESKQDIVASLFNIIYDGFFVDVGRDDFQIGVGAVP